MTLNTRKILIISVISMLVLIVVGVPIAYIVYYFIHKNKSNDIKGDTGGTDQNGNTGGTDQNGNTGGTDQNGNTGGTNQNGNTGGSNQNGNTGGNDQNGNTGGTDQNGNTGGTDQNGKIVVYKPSNIPPPIPYRNIEVDINGGTWGLDIQGSIWYIGLKEIKWVIVYEYGCVGIAVHKELPQVWWATAGTSICSASIYNPTKYKIISGGLASIFIDDDTKSFGGISPDGKLHISQTNDPSNPNFTIVNKPSVPSSEPTQIIQSIKTSNGGTWAIDKWGDVWFNGGNNLNWTTFTRIGGMVCILQNIKIFAVDYGQNIYYCSDIDNPKSDSWKTVDSGQISVIYNHDNKIYGIDPYKENIWATTPEIPLKWVLVPYV